jgi:hypothetical protein
MKLAREGDPPSVFFESGFASRRYLRCGRITRVMRTSRFAFVPPKSLQAAKKPMDRVTERVQAVRVADHDGSAMYAAGLAM